MRVGFAGVELNLPDGWLDVTDSLPEHSPFTLSRADGLGAIQFSVAHYRAGPTPKIDAQALIAMLCERAQSFPIPLTPSLIQSEPRIVVGGAASQAGETLGAWQISDGSNVAFVTYFASDEQLRCRQELAEAETIVKSITFP